MFNLYFLWKNLVTSEQWNDIWRCISYEKKDVFPAGHVSLQEASYHQESRFRRLTGLQIPWKHVIGLVGSVTDPDSERT